MALPTHGSRGLRSPQILVVDDQPPIRALCRRVLDRDGYDVEEASDGRVDRPNVTGISAAAIETLARYPWPGNVRGLQNAIEYAVAITRGTEVAVENLPATNGQLSISAPIQPVLAGSPFQTSAAAGPGAPRTAGSAPPPASAPAPVGAGAFPSLDELECVHIQRPLAITGGQRERAAELLGIDPKTLYGKLLRYEEEAGGPSGETAPTALEEPGEAA